MPATRPAPAVQPVARKVLEHPVPDPQPVVELAGGIRHPDEPPAHRPGSPQPDDDDSQDHELPALTAFRPHPSHPIKYRGGGEHYGGGDDDHGRTGEDDAEP